MAGSIANKTELAERFKAALYRLNPDGGKLGLAVSGGPDSMALLLLAQEAIPGAFEVATVDHGLRPEAKDECALVVAACKERGVPCEVLTVEVGEGNVQAKAREARYAALAEWAVRRDLIGIATAHHADDQAETLLMRLNRGSGLAGMAGIREYMTIRHSGPLRKLIRPLLELRRRDLRGLVEASETPFVHDPSNRDENFERVRVRNFLADVDWLDPVAFSRSAMCLADAEDALQEAAFAIYTQQSRKTENGLIFTPYANRGMLIRVTEVIFRVLGTSPRGGEVARLVDRLHHGEQGNLAGWLVSVEGDEWVFRPEPPRRKV